MPIPLGILAAAGFRPPAAAGSYDLLETVTLSSNAASVEFTNLVTKYSATYKHLQIRMITRLSNTSTATDQLMRFNGVTTSSYASHRMLGNGSSVVSQNQTSATSMLIGFVDGDQFTASVIDILDPFVTTKNKTARCLFGAHGFAREVMLTSGFLNSTNAISSVTLFPIVANYLAGTRISLYGIKG